MRTRKGEQRIPVTLPASIPTMQAPPHSIPQNMQQNMQNAALIQKNKTNAQLQAMVQVCGSPSINPHCLCSPPSACQSAQSDGPHAPDEPRTRENPQGPRPIPGKFGGKSPRSSTAAFRYVTRICQPRTVPHISYRRHFPLRRLKRSADQWLHPHGPRCPSQRPTDCHPSHHRPRPPT